jgi:hypothetical protein
MSSPALDNVLGVAAGTRSKLKGVNMVVVIVSIVLFLLSTHLLFPFYLYSIYF